MAAKFNLLRESNEGYAKLLTHAAEPWGRGSTEGERLSCDPQEPMSL